MRHGFRMEHKLRHSHLCNICQGENDEHATHCPRYLMGQIREVMAQSSFRCPACHEGTTMVNRDDFIECQGCSTQFTFGGAFQHEGCKYHFLGDNLAIRLDWKGKGDFPLLEQLKELVTLEQKLLQEEE